MISSFCSLDTTAKFQGQRDTGDTHDAALIAQAEKVAGRLPVTLQTAVFD